MVQRVRDKAKKPASKASGGAKSDGKQVADQAELVRRIRELEAERDQLKVDLAHALSRVAQLEESRTQVAGRIDSVIESLNTMGAPAK